MPNYPKIQESAVQCRSVDTFYGYDRHLKIRPGALYGMTNLTSDHFPLLAERPRRGLLQTVAAPAGLIGREKPVWISGSRLVYGGYEVDMGLSAAPEMLPKQMVSMGAYIVIFPDKKYINTADLSQWGSLDAVFTATGDVTYALCRQSGEPYDNVTVSGSPPAEPESGDCWLDTSVTPHSLKLYSAAENMWSPVPTVYVKLSSPRIGRAFSLYDGVEITGVSCPDAPAELQQQLAGLCGSHVIYGRGDDYIVVTGLLDRTCTQTVSDDSSVTVSRTAPEMDFVTECGNRLWGCKYGMVNGKPVNELYCCKLGDFKNWNCFMGLSTDSYRASLGADGPFTGAATLSGHPLFFRENSIEKIYPSAAGAHQITSLSCRGVQKGSWRSLQVVGGALYYKSPEDVCRYDGSLPAGVSEALGEEKFSDAAAGALGGKYYIAMTGTDGRRSLFVYDTVRGLWHREDCGNIRALARCGQELYFLQEDGQLFSATGSEGTPEDVVPWEAVSGLIGCEAADRKYLSRFQLKMKLPSGSSCCVCAEYDSSGRWEKLAEITGGGLNTFLLPVRPRRCDHMRLRLSGAGPFRLFSFTAVWERGSDVP